MDDRLGAALYGIEGLADYVFSCLGKDLDRNVIGDHISFDERTDEFKFGIGRSGESDLDLLEADINEELEELQLDLEAHGIDESLVSVS